MVKLRELEEEASSLLYNGKKGELGVLTMMLRKADLINKFGRGKHAAEMTPTDLANLILAILAPSSTKSAESVKVMRQSHLSRVDVSDVGPTRTWRLDDKDENGRFIPAWTLIPPEFRFFNGNLGDALDGVIAALPTDAFELRDITSFRNIVMAEASLRVSNEISSWQFTYIVRQEAGQAFLSDHRSIDGSFVSSLAYFLKTGERPSVHSLVGGDVQRNIDLHNHIIGEG